MTTIVGEKVDLTRRRQDQDAPVRQIAVQAPRRMRSPLWSSKGMDEGIGSALSLRKVPLLDPGSIRL